MRERIRQMLFGTLRGRLIMGVALVHAVMMLLFLWDLTVRQQSMIREQGKEQAGSLSQTLAVSSEGWMAARDLAGLQELVDALKRYPDLEFAMLLAQDGRVLAHTDSTKVGLYLIDLPTDYRQQVLHHSLELVDVAVPVTISGRPIGWARVGIGQKLVGRKLAVITRDGLLYALAAILIGSLMAWLVGRAVTRRLYTMQEVIDQVKAGNNQARIVLAGSDEAAHLSAEFNSMLDTIEQRCRERDLAVEQMQNSEEFLQNVLENIPDMVFVKDAAELRFVSLNRAAEELLGISRDTMIGKNDFDFFPEDQARHFIDRDRTVLASGGMIDIQEEMIRTAAGPKLLLTKKIAILNSKGLPCYLLGISEDITLRKQTELALIEAKETAEAVSRAKTEFLNMLSHELRTPLNGVMGGIQLLQLTGLDSEQQEYLTMIADSAEKELALVGDLLDLTGIEAGVVRIASEPFSLRSVVQDVVTLFEPGCQAKGLSLVLELDQRLPEQLRGDGKRIGQLLAQLLDNALKFTFQGRITVAVTLLEQAGPALRIGLAVTDTGIGIPAAMHARIFESFTQVDMSDTRQFGGTGMGLTICRRLLDAMEGSIRMESEPGKGSSFLVELHCLTADDCADSLQLSQATVQPSVACQR